MSSNLLPTATSSSTISRAASALATALPASPAIINNPASLSFNNSIFITIYVLMGLTAITEAVALAALFTQLARKEQRRIVQKTVRPEGVYFLPHSPVLAPLMVAIYATVALATLGVLKSFLWQGSAVAVIQRLSLLLPMPMLLFAWLSACSNAFAWHLTPMGNSRFQHFLRFKPMVLNLITWITPFAVFAVNLVLVIIWPILQSDAKALRKTLTAFEAAYPDDDAGIEDLTVQYTRKLRQAEGIYQAVWAIWALAYGLVWLVYSTYSSLLIALLGRQMKFVASSSVLTDPGVGQSQHTSMVSSTSEQGQLSTSLAPSPAAEAPSSRPGTGDPTVTRPGSSAGDRKSLGGSVKRRSHTTLKFIASVGPEMRYISKRELLRRNTRLVIFELVAFSIFTVAWWGLSITKAAMGYRILTNPITGPITVIGELFESTIFGLVVVSMLLTRGINILRNRKEQISQGVGSEESQSSQTESRATGLMDLDAETEKTSSKTALEGNSVSAGSRRPTPNLAARRGKSLLAINLGSGTYFVPAGMTSRPTTPLEMPGSRRGSAQMGAQGFPGVSSTQHLLPYDEKNGDSPASSAQASSLVPSPAFLAAMGPSSPTSDKLAAEFNFTRRKSSVTFADGISPMSITPARSPPMHTPTLEIINASPMVPQMSLFDALTSSRSEVARSLPR